MDFINNINLMHKNWTPSNTWEDDLCKNELRDKLLIKKYPPSKQEQNTAKQYGKTVINVIDKLDQESINKSADAMIALSTIFSLPALISPLIGGLGGALISKTNKTLKNQTKLSAFNGAMIGSAVYFIFSDFIKSQLEKTTTRIARFQSRNNETNDLSQFVIQSQKNSSLHLHDGNNTAKLNIKKTYKEAFHTLNEMKNDYNKYKEWRKDFREKEQVAKNNLKNINFTDEELQKAQKDRNKIINTVYKLELASNNEEINFQYALSLLQYAAKMSGAALATLICFLIPKGASAKTTKPSFIEKISKYSIPVIVPIFSLILGAASVKYQKDSAKLGRYEKKKELINDENNFITFSDKARDDLNANPVLNKKANSISKIIEDLRSIKTMPRRLKTMYSDTNSQTKVTKENFTQEQLEDAKLLQKQLFYSYEKIDEKSEGFSDDIDAVLHSTKMGLGTAINVAFNIYAINLLTKKLKNFNGQKMPGFFEGLKLMKHLSGKDMLSIFVLPYIIKSTICIIIDTLSAQCRKKANKVGIMTAIKDLEDEKVYTKQYLENVI